MDKTIKKYWLTMPDHRLRTHLYDTLKFPPDLAASLIERVGAMREERRAKAIKQTICAKAWEELLTAPRAELGNIRTMKAQLKREGGENTLRWHSLCAYEAVLVELIGRMKEHQRQDLLTPKQLTAQMRAQGKHLPRGDGLHWVDHVPLRIKEKVEGLFNALPPTKRGKTKVPFERTIPLRQFKATRIKLIKELVLAQELAEQELDMARVPEEVERLTALINDITRAQFLLDQHKRSFPLPPTWRGLLK
jgi:hypothetical protein